MSDETTGRLRHSDDSGPGITRRRHGRYWQYFDARRKSRHRPRRDRPAERDRPAAGLSRRLVLAPPQRPYPGDRHLTSKGRKQYRYHPDFRARRDKSKYDRTADFGRALPKLRKRVAADLRKRSLSCDTIAAAIVRLMDCEYLRVGNESLRQGQ